MNGLVAWSIENSNTVQIVIFRDRLLSANQRLFRITPAPCVIVGNDATRQIVNHIRRYIRVAAPLLACSNQGCAIRELSK